MSGVVRDDIDRHRFDLLHGDARLAAEGRVHVVSDGGERVLGADVVLVATGSRPLRPPAIPFFGIPLRQAVDCLLPVAVYTTPRPPG